jgi:crotonobetainyl-CoA:carnitine CoA-transferase CaiB-like acyl-CoA transferase
MVGVWAAPVLDYDALFAHPAVQGADLTEEADHPTAGRIRLLRFPLEFSSGRATVRRLPPESGEHSEEILRELGYAETEIRDLQQQKVV